LIQSRSRHYANTTSLVFFTLMRAAQYRVTIRAQFREIIALQAEAVGVGLEGAARQRCYCSISSRATGVHRRTRTYEADFSWGSYRLEAGALFSRRGVD
jgi:hypothetical protein